MQRYVAAAAALAATALCVPTPAGAAACWSSQAVAAAKLRSLDLMLRATARTCRAGADDFQADYRAFAAAHQGELEAAAIVLRGHFADGGEADPGRALERASATVTQGYGAGHPELGCRELGRVARDLAATTVPNALLGAADALVGQPAFVTGRCGVRVARMR